MIFITSLLQAIQLKVLDAFFLLTFPYYKELPVINAAIVVANHATHFNTLTILSPVGDFWLIINLIFINNFIITSANIQHYFKNANFSGLFWF